MLGVLPHGGYNLKKNNVNKSSWKENFRMSKEFLQTVKSVFGKKTTQMRTPISVEFQVGIFLYYISYEGRYQKTANAFGISRASVMNIIKNTPHTILKFIGNFQKAKPKLRS